MNFAPNACHDFYDVPVPANSDPTSIGTRDKAIDFGDVGAVLFHTGALQRHLRRQCQRHGRRPRPRQGR